MGARTAFLYYICYNNTKGSWIFFHSHSLRKCGHITHRCGGCAALHTHPSGMLQMAMTDVRLIDTEWSIIIDYPAAEAAPTSSSEKREATEWTIPSIYVFFFVVYITRRHFYIQKKDPDKKLLYGRQWINEFIGCLFFTFSLDLNFFYVMLEIRYYLERGAFHLGHDTNITRNILWDIYPVRKK